MKPWHSISIHIVADTSKFSNGEVGDQERVGGLGECD